MVNPLNKNQINTAQSCYLFGDDTLYVVLDENKPVFVYQLNSKEWKIRDYDSFANSWDFDPYVFISISNEKAIKMIWCDNQFPHFFESKVNNSDAIVTQTLDE